MNQTDTTPQGLLQAAAEADRIEILGGSISIRVRAEDSDGRLALVEQRLPGGYPGPPLHVHPEFDELFYVLDGELSLRIGERTETVGAGGVAFVPRGVPHTFANRSGRPAHSLVLVTPAGLERYFESLVDLLAASEGMPDPERLAALNEAHGTVVLA
ncbi:MAG: cupin domain-containing protein [Actinobacteria bacterium]|nr:cupin domain-containing protein [Actinomycetota bacterium]